MNKNLKIGVLTIGISALCLVSCKHNEHQNIPGGEGAAAERAVLTLSARDITTYFEFPASVEGQQVIEIRPIISGYVKEIHVKEGDFVKKGQLLFVINNPQYEQDVVTARASVKSAEANVNSARMEVEKVKPLVDKEIVSQYELQSAELTLKAKEAALEQAKADLANANTNLGYTRIASPQDGTIGTLPYKIGALVSSSSSDALTTLSNIDVVYAYFSWNEKKLLDFLMETPGTTMDEKLSNFPPVSLILANGVEYAEKGKIEMASGLIDTETGSAIFKAVFPNPTGIVRSGSSAMVRIPEYHKNVLVIPQSITSELQDKRFVYVLGENNAVQNVTIATTSSSDGQYFIVNEGLKAGDRVVIEGLAALRDGMSILPKDCDENAIYEKLK